MKYVMVRLTLAQAQAAINACDLIADQYDADGNRQEAAVYERAERAIEAAIESKPRRTK